MITVDPKPWEPFSQFSWMQEREELIADKRIRLEHGELETDERGNQKLELRVPIGEVIRYAKFARNHDEYWSASKKIINGVKNIQIIKKKNLLISSIFSVSGTV